MILKPLIGLQQTPKSARNVMLPLKRMVDVITWCAKIRTAKQTFVGFVWVRGNLMAVLGITVIDMTKMKRKQLEMRRNVLDLHYSVIFSIVIDT